MATASTIKLEASQKPEGFFVEGISAESAETASRLLQENHEKHHIFFNQDKFHNHIVHHLLTLFALKATPAEIQEGYNNNRSYQRPSLPFNGSTVQDMHDPERFKKYLGNEKYYNDFVVFFQEEIAKKGWESVIVEYVFNGDERADDMLVRMFGGFLHPLIHLGFGVEFHQPAIIAEALAQAAVHDDYLTSFFMGAEKAARINHSDPRNTPLLADLLDEMRRDKTLSASAHWEDGNKVRDGVLKRAPQEMIQFASRYVVAEEELEEKVAEMVNAVVYYTTTAQHPPHIPKYDFFYMHCVNSSIFFTPLVASPTSPLTPPQKTRLLEWKVRIDLAMYVSRHSPALLLDEIQPPSSKGGGQPEQSWEDVFRRVRRLKDDGHASKFVRALAHGERVCGRFEGRKGFVVEGEMWRWIAKSVVDSVEAGGPDWVRSCGFEEAWVGVPLREGARL
ncbi:hypothetical protein DM02DRAFT_628097 [Periconia macrospinosa]|uniref:HypA-like protein n=1 Tax=Periconia macrospinosa TaxID=97972 RepID=A0A2V1DUL9_9PLEO|nr:hypothetical protein DM02DRAFT_628097 [Periconia macrospinosa]